MGRSAVHSQESCAKYQELHDEHKREIAARSELHRQLKEPQKCLVGKTDAPRARLAESTSLARSYSDYVQRRRGEMEREREQKRAAERAAREQLLPTGERPAELVEYRRTCTPRRFSRQLPLNLEEDPVKRMEIQHRVAQDRLEKMRVDQRLREDEAAPHRPQINADFPFRHQQRELMKLPAPERLYAQARMQEQSRRAAAAAPPAAAPFRPEINSNTDQLVQSKIQRELENSRAQAELDAPAAEPEPSYEFKKMTDGEYQAKMHALYDRGLDTIDFRHELAALSESTSILLANSTHTTRNSEKIAALRRRRFCDKIFGQLVQMSGNPEAVSFDTDQQNVPLLRVPESMKSLVLEALIAPGGPAALTKDLFARRLTEVWEARKQEVGQDVGWAGMR